MAAYPQWIVWTVRDGKKLPVNPATGLQVTAHDTGAWMSYDAAASAAVTLGAGYGAGFVFADSDPFFFLDIDHCAENGAWSPLAQEIMASLPGAAIEVSQSGTGLHIFGRGACPPHACKNQPLGIELYTEKRFVALTGSGVVGDASTDCSPHLAGVVAKWFPPKIFANNDGWTSEPCEGSYPIEDDDELIEKACNTASMFGGRATFAQLWSADADALGSVFPDSGGERLYDESSADASLAQHLAFWTGNNCERIQALMMRSGLVRDKWDREDYMQSTILHATGLQTQWYTAGAPADNSLAEQYGGVKLKGSKGQREFAERVRAQLLAQASEEIRAELCATVGPITSASTWITNKSCTPDELAARVRPAAPAAEVANGPRVIAGLQYLPAEAQVRHFAGCCYIREMHRVHTPNGMLLRSEQFNVVYGGWTFQFDDMGEKTTKRAWEAFTESQAVRWPDADSTCFRPDIAPGVIVEQEGRRSVNCYAPIDIERAVGDATPFLSHLAKVLPDQRDRDLFLAYMAACVQHKGYKFQWAPLIQGCEGNGKTLFTRCVSRAVGRRYSHFPKAAELDSKFNAWLLNKLFIGVEDMFVSANRQEVLETLKPMITGGDGLEIQMKGVDQITADVCANFILNSNHVDAIKKTENDRRFAVFCTAQQCAADLKRDGMDGGYFPSLYNWLDSGGYAIVAELLHTYPIPDEYNPTTQMQRAPITSTTLEVIQASKGRIEQEVAEAVAEGRVGFAGGWISSVALERLLQGINMSRSMTHHKRREMLESMGYAYHPHLRDGRANNPVTIDDGKKPRLYIHAGADELRGITAPAEVLQRYVSDQQPTGA
jgi:hypothetical protein